MTDKKTVLIVDDTPDNITLLSSLLKDDYKTRIATNGQRADNFPDMRTLPKPTFPACVRVRLALRLQ